MDKQQAHYSVLLKESVDALVKNPSGLYIDGTFGRGGHSRAVLNQLDASGVLVAFDKDPEAIRHAKSTFGSDARFSIMHDSFAHLDRYPDSIPAGGVDGVLLDLGVSSPQLDDAARGFSFLHDGPLDMRMNNAEGTTAAEWIAHVDEADLVTVLRDFGEERFAKRIARAIVEAREEDTITTTLQLSRIVAKANPKWEKGKNPATRSFQAIRIALNRELDDLQGALSTALEVLKPGGRLVVISFHSLEDRIVKRFFRAMAKGKEFPKCIPVTEDMLDIKMRLIGKATKAGDDELDENIRSRSAVLRIAEKI